MNWRKNHAGKMSVAGGFAMLFVGSQLLGAILGPARCRDGWRSSSIGRPGACSWHGGVDDSRSFFFLVLFVASVAFAFWLYGKLEFKPPAAPGEPVVPRRCVECGNTFVAAAATSIVRCNGCLADGKDGGSANASDRSRSTSCPDCGSRMVARTARSGKWAGQRFLGCSRYPRCRGIRQIEPSEPDSASS